MRKPYPVYLSFLFILLVAVGCSKFSRIQKSKDYDLKLTKADEYFQQKNYKFAKLLYEELFPVLKGTERFEDLYYKYAYCFYNEEDYLTAENLFKGYLEVFPNSTKAEEIDYLKAYCCYKLSPKVELEQVNTVRAIGMMQTFINTHPGSERNKEATEIIDAMRVKLEKKEYRSADLYFKTGEFKAASIAFAGLLNNYPESQTGDYYKWMIVQSCYKYAVMSATLRQEERFRKVVEEFEDLSDRYPDSKYLADAKILSQLSEQKIKNIQNEQTTSSSGQ
jgi:outer membrane protein assembly factor BamD